MSQVSLQIQESVQSQVSKLNFAALEMLATEILDRLASEDLAPADAELSLLICSDAEIRELNHDYRGKDKPTDVLTFSMQEAELLPGMQHILGDVVISWETMLRQADEYDVNPYQELLRLLIHGILHALGFDHENVSEEEAQQMRGKEEELYNSFLTVAKSVLGTKNG